ncbi:hypothetical protein BDU57DRAFT_125804 [Ampelomyces quisqualis]|uniref:Uncharacterized protein n=1 Tax=Ampelomyces quisqualis TaxID=50730 RepID=A0A6A5QWJ9_AMPQU|nr:hypothetical protein BDU57DRAFT_125804 [Ampelomyces quisqualis]
MPIFGRRHSRKASHDHSKPPSQSQSARHKADEEPQAPPKHQRTHTAPEAPTLLRLPSTKAAVSATPRPRRGASASYCAPQTTASGADARSPPTRRPPASFSAGHDTSRGPPVTLLTRGNSDYARRPSPLKPADYAFAQHQLQQLGLVSPGMPPPTRAHASSVDDESASDSPDSDAQPPSTHDRGEPPEDLFLNIAHDVAPKPRPRIARGNRLSSPSALQSPSPRPAPSAAATPTGSRIPSTAAPRRSSLLPAAPSPAPPLETPRARPPDLSAKASFSARRDADLSPRDFLAQLGSQRRGSQPDALHTPPGRTSAYRPSNLGHYAASRPDAPTPAPEPAQQREPSSHADGTESHGSTGPAVSVWDELDELKTRIRRIEMGGKIPATSGAVVSQATAERPRTANTSATTVSSSPNHQRKSNPSPSESTVDAHTSSRTHPLLREALAKARQHTSPAVYRILDATAAEAFTLAEMTGSAGPQGTLHSASSILGGANVSDRQVRRKADNICRSLTELCIALCDAKPALSSPAVRSSTATISRRPSVQINGESPTVRQSIEPESNSISSISPSRALHRIEARRTSMLYNSNGTPRDSSFEPYDVDRQTSSRLSRAGTSLHRNHRSIDDDDDDPITRAPSRAMTDFRSLRPTEKSRLTARQYASREPIPELQSPSSLQSAASLRRPTVSGNENSLLFRDNSRRYDLQRESSPAFEKQVAGSVRARTQLAVNRNPNNRNSISGVSDLARSATFGRRQRGNSAGE